MKKTSIKNLFILGVLFISIITLTGCGKKKETNTEVDDNKTVINNQIFEGLEFVNVGVDNNIVETVVINNTGYIYEGSKFSMKIMDKEGNVIVELQDEVTESMETGTTKNIKTKSTADLKNAASIEYSVVTE